MPYSDSHRYVFVAVPKTGSTTLRSALSAMHSGQGGHQGFDKGRVSAFQRARLGLNSLPGCRSPWFKHLSAVELEHVLGEKFDRYFKFALVRNPWSRAVSRYHFSRSDAKPGLLQRLMGRTTRSFHGLSFEDWVDSRLRHARSKPGGHLNMLDKLVDREGRLVMDFVGSLEHFDRDLRTICARIDLEYVSLPRKNVATNNSRHYSDFYTPELIEKVAEIYQRDVEAFGYTFDGLREDSPLHDPSSNYPVSRG